MLGHCDKMLSSHVVTLLTRFPLSCEEYKLVGLFTSLTDKVRFYFDFDSSSNAFCPISSWCFIIYYHIIIFHYHIIASGASENTKFDRALLILPIWHSVLVPATSSCIHDFFDCSEISRAETLQEQYTSFNDAQSWCRNGRRWWTERHWEEKGLPTSPSPTAASTTSRRRRSVADFLCGEVHSAFTQFTRSSICGHLTCFEFVPTAYSQRKLSPGNNNCLFKLRLRHLSLALELVSSYFMDPSGIGCF